MDWKLYDRAVLLHDENPSLLGPQDMNRLKKGDVVCLIEEAYDERLGRGWFIECLSGPREGYIGVALDSDLVPFQPTESGA